MDIRRVGILYNPRIARALPLAGEIAAWVEQRGAEAHIGPAAAAAAAATAADALNWAEIGLLVTLGGDGSILRAARAAAPYGIPILGVNLGRVGFLTEADPITWADVLARVWSGEGWIEERMMLSAEVERDGGASAPIQALNDIVIGRGARAQVVRLVTEINGGHLATYVADGLIVATPTGSTAYALAAGGPVLPPQLRNIILTPVAPHLSMERSVVLPEDVIVRIAAVGGRPAVLTVDGRIHAELGDGDAVVVKASTHIARFARVQERTYFYKTLLQRLTPRNGS